jgi:hypothetical protein
MELGFIAQAGFGGIDVAAATSTLPNFGIYIGGAQVQALTTTGGGSLYLGTATVGANTYVLQSDATNLFINSPASGGSIEFSYGNGNSSLVLGLNLLKMNSITSFGFTGGSGSATGALDTLLSRAAAANVQFGAANVNGAPVAQTISFQGALAGSATNQASANTTIVGSLGTGTGTNGDFIFQCGVKTSTGTAQATATTCFTLKGETLNAVFAGQLVAANMTQSSAAQSGTVCWAVAGLTYDATLGCLTSTMEAKDGWHAFTPREALTIVTRLEAGSFTYKRDLGLPDGPQVGLNAQQVASIDDRLVGYGPDGKLRGVRYQQTSALYGPAIRALDDDVQQLRADNDNLRAELDQLRRSIGK